MPQSIRRLLALPTLVLMLMLAAIGGGALAAPPRRIVSLNLCADQYVIALADPGRIAGLSQFARDPDMSYFAARARSLPAVSRGAEQVLMLRPDLIVGAPFRQRAALAPLEGRGVRFVDLPNEDSLSGIERTITIVANAIGHPERGTALIADIHARLVAIGPPPGRGRVAAYYQRRGYLTGAGTLVDEMMRRVGLANLATRLGRPQLSRLSVEQMAMARPDFLILESATARVADQGTELLQHPVFDGVSKLYVPEALTVCGGPAYPQAVALLAARIRAADRVAQAGRTPHHRRTRTPP